MATTRRNQTGNTTALQRIPPNTAGAGGGAGGGATNRPAPAPTGPAPLIGAPEFLPQHTFISVALEGDNGFIANATRFHTNVGLDPDSVGSIEQILELLADAGETGTGLLDRIRIVSHFFHPGPGHPDQPSNMGINFLTHGGRGALKRHFEGFAQSSIAGLRALVTWEGRIGGTTVTTLTLVTSENEVLVELRSHGQAAVVDAVFPPLAPPSDNKIEFVKLHASKWGMAHNSPALPNALRTDLDSAYDLILADLRTRLGQPPDNVAAPQLDALAAAIAGLGQIPGAPFVNPGADDRYADNVHAGLAAFAGDSFRNKLLAVRPRFDRFTTIDIRGCQAGADVPYLQAVQAFFGRSSTVRPVVTAPNLFQFFNQIPEVTRWGTTPQAAAQGLNNLFTSGFAPHHSPASLQSQFADWADAFGITDAHLTFWRTTFQLPALEFCRLQWRSNIPARRVTIPRLDALPGAGLADVFTRLSDIFFVRASRRPTAAQIAEITPHLGSLATWAAQLAQPINAAGLATHFGNYKTIYEAVDARMPGFMNSPQRVIPAAQPPGLTAQQTENLRNNLSTFIQTNDNSIFKPVRVWEAEALSMTQGAPARMRYFLALGLVFQLAHDTSTSLDAQRIVVYDDRRSPGTKDEAIRHWMRAAWRGVAPPTIAPSVSYELGRDSAWLVVGREQGPSHVCPHQTYMDHIVVEPA